MKEGREKWEGGYVRVLPGGRRLYVIERRWRTRRFHISTKTSSARVAYEHLRRFESDPAAYEAAMRATASGAEGLPLTAELVLEFHGWLLHREVPATRKHANEMANRLADWIEDLRGRDLRQLDLGHLKGCLDRRKTCRQHRIIALKSLCSWLRTERHILSRAEDVTQDLRVPQARPEKHRRRKAVEVERVRAALERMDQRYADVLTLAAATGWHTTELERFARDEESELLPGQPGSEVLAVLMVRHKTGSLTRTPLVDPYALEAAQRIRAAGTHPKRFNDALRAACIAAGVQPFTLGVMRHSVGTWAVEAGALPEAVAEFLDHRDKRTTKRFYIDVASPTASLKLPSLH